MTAIEAVKEITSKVKYYDGIMAQPQASATANEILKGKSTPAKIKSFLEKFGYKVEVELKISKDEKSN